LVTSEIQEEQQANRHASNLHVCPMYREMLMNISDIKFHEIL